MKKVTSYLVAMFAFALLLSMVSVKSAHAWTGTITGTIISAHETAKGSGEFTILIKTDDDGMKKLTICNQNCYDALLANAGGDPSKVTACPVCAKCCAGCLEALNANKGKRASFLVCQDPVSKKLYLQAEPCCSMEDPTSIACSDGDAGICYPCSGTIYQIPEGSMVKCFHLLED